MSDHGTKDALGQDIIIGNYYGYSVDSNGVTTTTVGEAVKFTLSGKLTLNVLFSRKALWMHDAENHEHETKSVSVKPSKVFPISQEVIDDYQDSKVEAVINYAELEDRFNAIDKAIGKKFNEIQNENENLVIYYDGKPLTALNSNLVKKQNLTEEEINILKNLHIEMHEIKEQMKKTDDPNELHELAFIVENLEFMMQGAWGFVKDRNYHTHWINVPKCICPKMDNQDNYGTPYRVIRDDCPVHGKIK
jgi:hypothetical protein